MSGILKSKPAVTKPNSFKEIKNDIQCKEAEADFTRKNILSWTVLFLLLISAVLVFAVFFYRFFTDTTLQDYVINQIKNNIVFIIVSALAILKINITNQNK